MIGVKVGDEHAVQIGEANRTHELALGALAAVEQDSISAPPQQHGGQPAPRAGHRTGGAGEEHRHIHDGNGSAGRSARDRPAAGPARL